MPVLTLQYRHCGRKLPSYLKNPEVENVAGQVRQQLVDASTDAISLASLRDINRLNVNGIDFDLWIDTEHPITDDEGNAVLGVCEFDPDASTEAISLLVTPVCVTASAELVLSTFAHVLGHAIFAAPSWIFEAAKGPGLFVDPHITPHKAYRIETRDVEHLTKPYPAQTDQFGRNPDLQNSIRFAEWRANEFMGSLLVPRNHLHLAVEELAGMHGVTINRNPSLDPDSPGMTMQLSTHQQAMITVPSRMFALQNTLAKRFGVNRRFIQVRMERYGLIKQGININ